MASESSDDDQPLAQSNGLLSHPRVSKADDAALDKSVGKAKAIGAGISIRNGPVRDANGSKRRSRPSLSKVGNQDELSEDSDVVPLAKRQKSKHYSKTHIKAESAVQKAVVLPPSCNDILDSSDNDKPLIARLSERKADIEKTAAREAKKIRAAEAKSQDSNALKTEDHSDDDKPSVQRPKKRQSNGTASDTKKRKLNGLKPSDNDSAATPVKKRQGRVIASSANSTPAKPKIKGKATGKASGKALGKKADTEGSPSGDDDDEEEKEYEWWNEAKREDDSIKWTTLEHNGVLFPPPYKRLPSHVKLVYDRIPVDLSEEAEEVAYFFGSMLKSKLNVDNPTFQANFFNDFQKTVEDTAGARDSKGKLVKIEKFSKLDFSRMHEYWETLDAAKKARSPSEKKAEKEEKTAAEAPFMYCKWDGRKEKVGNFRVEPPGLFRGRGEHPKTGKLKLRVLPEQVTINIGQDAPIPKPPAGHKWRAVTNDNKATWLAMWQENVNGNYKYVMLAATSAVKGQSDFKKFEKARELKKYIDKVRKDYMRDLKSQVMADRQRATAVYLIDKLALRAGNEKDAENEAETVGCCSLKFEHVTLRPPNIVIFDFLGKDSVRYYDEVAVDVQVFKNLKLFKKPPKDNGDDIFDRLNTTQLNKHLSSYMKGLTAKVFRTYNASFTMSEELKKLKDSGKLSTLEKVSLYNDCNRKVAILCNHKRTVGESHGVGMKKMEDKLIGLRYQKWRLKQMILDIDPKAKKQKGAAFFEIDNDITQEWILEHQAALVEAMRQQITKKFQKENQKLLEEKSALLPDSELNERLEVAQELESKFSRENKTKKVLAEGKSPTVDKIEASISKCDARIKEAKTNMTMKDSNKEISLGTSKTNYIDPRLTVVFAKKFKVPLERFFSKSLREKFNWAVKSVENDSWEF